MDSKKDMGTRQSASLLYFISIELNFFNLYIQMDWLALVSLPLIPRNFTYRDQLIPHRLIPPLKTHFKGLAQLSGLNGW